MTVIGMSRLLLFALVFCVEVKVRADVLTLSHDPLQEPLNCLHDSAKLCAVETGEGEKLILSVGKSEVHLSEFTTVMRNTDHEIRLIRGSLWVRPKDHEMISVRTEFGLSSSNTEYWVTRTDERMTILATGGEVLLNARNSKETLTVPRALENYIGRISKLGIASTGIPITIDPTKHIERWARLYSGKRSDFEKDVAAFKLVWTEANEQASSIHKELYERKVASLDKAAHEKQESRRKVEVRNRELRDLFRTKFLSGE